MSPEYDIIAFNFECSITMIPPEPLLETSAPSMVAFRTFNEEGGALDMAQWLEERGIPAEADCSQLFNNPYIGNSILTREYVVRIPLECFDQANESMVKYFNNQLARVPSDYYLFNFTNEELLGV